MGGRAPPRPRPRTATGRECRYINQADEAVLVYLLLLILSNSWLLSCYLYSTETHTWLVVLLLCSAMLLLPLWWYIAHHNQYTHDVLYNGWPPIIGAMVIDRWVSALTISIWLHCCLFCLSVCLRAKNICYLRQRRRYMFLPVLVCLFVCLSVCLLARLLKKACIDLDEMLRVDRCRDVDELVNFWARSGS